MLNKVFCLMGPTAAGKTALACELVQLFPFEIISVDSAMIYKGMDIGTAKPTHVELQQAPHHLIDILEPPQSFSAAQFCQETWRLCTDILGRNKIPLLVGGTMMYFNALQQGLSCLPEANTAIRNQIIERSRLFGWQALHAELALIDPLSAEKINSHDSQRIQRAFEVYYLTGKPLSDFFLHSKTTVPYKFINFLLIPNDRAWLHKRISQRFNNMLANNFLEEAEQLLQQWHLPETAPARRIVGYRQAYDYLAGKENYSSFCDKALAATRQLAKRQLTWLRHWPNPSFFACDEACTQQEIVAKVSKIISD